MPHPSQKGRKNCKSVVLNDFYLYRHIRLDKNVPFYIGVGTKKDTAFANFKREYWRAFNMRDRNFLWKRVKNVTDISVEILFESNNYEEVLNKEKYFIKLYGRRLYGGTLINMTDGGEVFSQNCRQASRKRGYETFGDKHPSSLLSEDNVMNIIKLFNSGVRPIEISRKYPQVGRYAIYSILNKKTWRHLSYLIKDDAYVFLYDKDNFHLNKRVIDVTTNEVVPSISALSKKLNKPESTVRNWLLGKVRNKSNYKLLK